MMKITLFLLFFMFTGASCLNKEKETTFMSASPVSINTSSNYLRYLALGDSYTIGESVEPEERWAVQLAQSLRENNIDIDDPVIIARTGWTTDELSTGIDKATPEAPFDLVSLLIGVNNQYRGRDAEEYRQEFVVLLERAIGFAGGKTSRVFVLSIPDWGVMPFAQGRDRAVIAEEINLFNVINREETVNRGISYIDITPISRQATEDPTAIAPDGLHPSGSQYTAWTTLMLPVVLGMMGD